jgi:hypothetical protein
MFHIPNGGSRNILEACNLKKLGVKAGVSDIFYAYPCGGKCGLWIEMKGLKSIKYKPTVSKEQKDWIEKMESNGYDTAICYGFEEAKDAILSYLSTERSGYGKRA